MESSRSNYGVREMTCEDYEDEDGDLLRGLDETALEHLRQNDGGEGMLARAERRLSHFITSRTVAMCIQTVMPRGLRRALSTVCSAMAEALTARPVGKNSHACRR